MAFSEQQELLGALENENEGKFEGDTDVWEHCYLYATLLAENYPASEIVSVKNPEDNTVQNVLYIYSFKWTFHDGTGSQGNSEGEITEFTRVNNEQGPKKGTLRYLPAEVVEDAPIIIK